MIPTVQYVKIIWVVFRRYISLGCHSMVAWVLLFVQIQQMSFRRYSTLKLDAPNLGISTHDTTYPVACYNSGRRAFPCFSQSWAVGNPLPEVVGGQAPWLLDLLPLHTFRARSWMHVHHALPSRWRVWLPLTCDCVFGSRGYLHL